MKEGGFGCTIVETVLPARMFEAAPIITSFNMDCLLAGRAPTVHAIIRFNTFEFSVSVRRVEVQPVVCNMRFGGRI